MPLLTYAVPDFQPFTKIKSADVNSRFNDIKTLFNVTKLDSTNVQDAGLLVGKLATTGGSAGQFVGSNGSIITFISNPLTAQFNIIVGSAAQVTAGVATHSSLITALASAVDSDRVLLLPGYNSTENISVTKKIYFTGLGASSVITGTVTFTSAADEAHLTNCRITDNVTLNSGADSIIVDNVWIATGKTFTDNGISNYILALQE